MCPAEIPRVAQVIETMTMGGAENLAVRIANALARRGVPSHLIVIEGPGPLSPRIDPLVAVHYLEFRRAPLRNPLRFAGSLRRGLRLLTGTVAEQGIQVVQTHLPGANFWGLLLQLRGACRVVATVHNNQEFNYGESGDALRLRLRKTAYRQIVRRCAGTVAVSAEVRASLARELGLDERRVQRVHVVPNGVDVPAPLDPRRRAELRARWGRGAPLILAAGRFSEQKNHADLVAAAAALHATGTPFRLVIAGDGELREPLLGEVARRGLQDVVEMPGNLADLGEVMGAADLFTMSSRWEGLPLVLLEAQAAGLPCVAYDIPGVRELVRPGETGVLVPAGSASGLAAGWRSLLESGPERSRLGAGARGLVRARYDFQELIRKLMEIYSANPGHPV